MNCRDLETQLTPYLDGELIAEARVEVEAHLATCPTCPKHVEVERHNLSVIREAARTASPVAPPEFKAKLFANIARDANRQQRIGIGRFAAMAAGVTLAVVVGYQGYRGHQRKLYEQDAAMRHARQFPLEITQSPDAIERWFGGKLDHPVNVPRFPNATATGARLLQVRDKPAAYIRYDSPHPMGLFVFGDDLQQHLSSEVFAGACIAHFEILAIDDQVPDILDRDVARHLGVVETTIRIFLDDAGRSHRALTLNRGVPQHGPARGGLQLAISQVQVRYGARDMARQLVTRITFYYSEIHTSIQRKP